MDKSGHSKQEEMELKMKLSEGKATVQAVIDREKQIAFRVKTMQDKVEVYDVIDYWIGLYLDGKLLAKPEEGK